MKFGKKLLMLEFAILLIAFVLPIANAADLNYENNVWAPDCNKGELTRNWVKKNKDITLYFLASNLQVYKAENIEIKDNLITFTFDGKNIVETYKFDGDQAVLQYRKIYGDLLVRDGMLLSNNSQTRPLSKCDANTEAAKRMDAIFGVLKMN